MFARAISVGNLWNGCSAMIRVPLGRFLIATRPAPFPSMYWTATNIQKTPWRPIKDGMVIGGCFSAATLQQGIMIA